jgi:hypothetical protein
MKLHDIDRELSRRMERQRTYFDSGKGHFLLFGAYDKERIPVPFPPYGIPMQYLPDEQARCLSEEFLANYAFEIGTRIIENVMVETMNQIGVDDDCCPTPSWLNLGIDIGIGETTALFLEQDVVFQDTTSYCNRASIGDWDDLDKVKFDPDNRFVRYELEIWRGIQSRYEVNLPIITHQLRCPLDLANGLRGDQLFIDLHDSPTMVHELLHRCTQAIMDYESFMRREIPIMKSAPGGCCGFAMPRPGTLFLNGDPIDLIAPEMGDRFNAPYVRQLADFAGSVYFHHHSIGVTKVPNVAAMEGVTVQEIIQDPNGPRLMDYVPLLVQASRTMPIHLHLEATDRKELISLLEALKDGRFIIQMRAQTKSELNEMIAIGRRYG